MTAAEAGERLGQILREDFQVPPGAIRPDAHLRVDLGLDSLSLTDLAFLVQRDLGFSAEAEEFRGITTVGALAAFCADRVSAASAAAGG